MSERGKKRFIQGYRRTKGRPRKSLYKPRFRGLMIEDSTDLLDHLPQSTTKTDQWRRHGTYQRSAVKKWLRSRIGQHSSEWYGEYKMLCVGEDTYEYYLNKKVTIDADGTVRGDAYRELNDEFYICPIDNTLKYVPRVKRNRNYKREPKFAIEGDVVYLKRKGIYYSFNLSDASSDPYSVIRPNYYGRGFSFAGDMHVGVGVICFCIKYNNPLTVGTNKLKQLSHKDIANLGDILTTLKNHDR